MPEPLWMLTTGPYSIAAYHDELGQLGITVTEGGRDISERFFRHERRLSDEKQADFSLSILEANGLARQLREMVQELERDHTHQHER